MRGKIYCYYHHSFRLRQRRRATAGRPIPILLPPIEDAAAVQLGLMRIVDGIALDAISERKAGLMLYALQTAAHNLKQLPPDVAEALLRQDYPEALPDLAKLKQQQELDAGKSLASVLLTRLGLTDVAEGFAEDATDAMVRARTDHYVDPASCNAISQNDRRPDDE